MFYPQRWKCSYDHEKFIVVCEYMHCSQSLTPLFELTPPYKIPAYKPLSQALLSWPPKLRQRCVIYTTEDDLSGSVQILLSPSKGPKLNNPH